jgi:hypothetical protein
MSASGPPAAMPATLAPSTGRARHGRRAKLDLGFVGDVDGERDASVSERGASPLAVR